MEHTDFSRQGMAKTRDLDQTIVRTDLRTRKTVTTIVSIFLIVVALAVVLSILGVIRNPNPPSTLVAIAAALVTGGTLLIASIERGRVILGPDAVEVRGAVWPARRIGRSDIVGRRFHGAGWRSPMYHILVTRQGREVRLPPYLEHNRALQQWLATIPLMSTKTRRVR